MKEVKKISIPYVTDLGEEKSYEFNIRFTSNRIISDYTILMDRINSIQKSWMVLNQKSLEIPTTNDPLKVKELEEAVKKESERIKEIDANKFFEDRFELIKKILRMNGYTDENAEYYKWSFWDEHVDPKEINDFLTEVIYKDYDTKDKKKTEWKPSTKID